MAMKGGGGRIKLFTENHSTLNYIVSLYISLFCLWFTLSQTVNRSVLKYTKMRYNSMYYNFQFTVNPHPPKATIPVIIPRSTYDYRSRPTTLVWYNRVATFRFRLNSLCFPCVHDQFPCVFQYINIKYYLYKSPPLPFTAILSSLLFNSNIKSSAFDYKNTLPC